MNQVILLSAAGRSLGREFVIEAFRVVGTELQSEGAGIIKTV